MSTAILLYYNILDVSCDKCENWVQLSGTDPRRIRIILAAIDEATSLDDLTRPSWRLHELIGDRKGIWSMTVNGPWRITFSYDNGDFDILNLEQYHN